LSALNHPQPGYMTHEPEWDKFNPLVLVYGDGSWRVMGKEKVAARAGAILVPVSGDLYIIGTVAFYAITVLDAFVDASLANFDISPDLSMRLSATMLPDCDKSVKPAMRLNISF